MFKKLSLSSLFIGFLLLAACSKTSETPTTTSGGTAGTTATGTSLAGLASCEAASGQAVVCGQALAPDGKTPIAGAEVKLVSAGQASSVKGLSKQAGKLVANEQACMTDVTGNFACGGITQAGTCSLQITGQGFNISFSTNCVLGQTTQVEKSKTTATQSNVSKKFAVVTGDFDTAQNILQRIYGCGTQDELGLKVGTECPIIELISGDTAGIVSGATNPNTTATSALGLSSGQYVTHDVFLKSLKAMNAFDAIFINCGLKEDLITDATVKSNLKSYVENGKSLYVSDWAYDYLEQIWPDTLSFLGSGANGLSATPETEGKAEQGNVNDAQLVTIVDSGLSTWLGATAFNVDFDLPDWAVMSDAASSVNQLLTASSLVKGVSGPNSVPLTGKLTFPIAVQFKKGSGCVFYSSYHNEPLAKVAASATQSRVLEYLLVNKLGGC